MENIPTNIDKKKELCFLCDLLNIQKCNFKECPLIKVDTLYPLTTLLPFNSLLFQIGL
jgi:hypothetical protein